jgi:hypothetical protein
MIMLIIPPKLAAVTSVITFHTILIIDKIMETVQAHPLPFSNPYATTNETIAIATSTTPNAIPSPLRKDGTAIGESEVGGIGICAAVRLPCILV